jgi:hypothetical protein
MKILNVVEQGKYVFAYNFTMSNNSICLIMLCLYKHYRVQGL